MPVFDQGYRPYHGPVRRGPRALAIAWESFRPRMRWWIWLLTCSFLLWPYLVIGAITYLALIAGVDVGHFGRAVPTTIYAHDGPLDVSLFIAAIQSGSGGVFWELLNDSFASTGPVILPAVACAGILASDRRTGALQLYLARPVTRRDYLVGKLLAVCAFTGLVTAAPTLVVWIECVALESSWAFVASTWWVPASVVAASALYAAWAAGLVLVLSSLLRRPALIGSVAIFLYVFLLGLGEILGEVTDDKRWLALVPHRSLGAVTAPLFGLGVPDWLPIATCLPMAVGLPVLCLALAAWRVRAVEVVT